MAHVCEERQELINFYYFKKNNVINTLHKRDSLNLYHFSGEIDHSVPAHPGLCISQAWWNYPVEADYTTTASSASQMRARTPRLIFSEV